MNKKLIPSLNGIRAICIILVIGSHMNRCFNFPQKYSRILNLMFNGVLGVNVFFVLSGFLITYLLLKEEDQFKTISLEKFYKRRVIRIFPVYYLLLLVYFILSILRIISFTNLQWFTSLTYTKNVGGGSWIDGHLWSLGVEEQFYIFWPIVFKYFSKNTRINIAKTILIVSPFYRILSYKYFHNTYSFFDNADCLMWGCLSAIYLDEIVSFFYKFNLTLLKVISVLLILLFWNLNTFKLLGVLTVPFTKTIYSVSSCILIIVFSQFKTKTIGYIFLNLPVMDYLGTLSYSIYIWQQMFFDSRLGRVSSLPYNYLFIFITALISYNLIEKPILRLKNRFDRV